ncbi:MAG: hypothetical protein M0042_15290 [Nitrospiraceae bacterium]|nr:hypothetical protein [Nitrospiraceae bacterium]
MSGLISRKPLVGIAAGLLFGSLGTLLLGVENTRGLARILFKVSGYFFLFVAVVSLAAAVFRVTRSGRKA